MEAAKLQKCVEGRDCTRRLVRPSVPSSSFGEPETAAVQGASFPPPAAGRLARLGGADAEETGEGRHPTSAMRGEKRKRREGVGVLRVQVGAAFSSVTHGAPPYWSAYKHRKRLLWFADLLAAEAH